MGLFGKKKQEEHVVQQPAEEQKPQEAPELPFVRRKYDAVRVNLTDKMIRVEFEEDGAYIGRTIVQVKDDRIRLVHDGIIIAEIGKRSKAFKELEDKDGMSSEHMQVEAKEGDYGLYYRITLKFETVVIETE